MTQKDDSSAALAHASRPAMIKKSTAVLFGIMAFALGLYGGI